MDRLSILLIGGFVPWYHKAGGGHIFSYKLAEALAKKGHNVDFLVVSPTGRDKEKEVKWGNIIYSLPRFTNLLRRINIDKYDIVQLNILRETLWSSLNCLLQKTLTKNHKLAIEMHAPPNRLARFPRTITEPIRIYACKVADIVFCPSESSKRILSGRFYNIPTSRIKVTYAGVDEKFSLLKEKDFNKDRFNLLFCGKLCDRKGVDVLLRSLPIILREYQVKLYVVGEGVISKYRSLARELGVEKDVVFTGYVDDLLKYYSTADLFVFPSRSESFGLVVAEAMMSYLPVISTWAGAIPEVVKNGETGILVQPGNPVALGNAVKSLLKNPHKMKSMAGKGRRRAEKLFTWDAVARRVLKAYREILV